MSTELLYYYNIPAYQFTVEWIQVGQEYNFLNMFSYAGLLYLNVYPKINPENGRCIVFIRGDPLNNRIIFDNFYENTTKCHTIFYDPSTDSVVNVCPHLVSVYNASSNNAIYLKLTMDYYETNNFSFAIMCSNNLIIATQTSIQFY